MGKDFYIGQPLIVKGTGERVTFAYSNGLRSYPCNVLKKDRHDYYDYDDLEPSTEFTFPELISGLEQGYFDEGTKFRLSGTDRVIIAEQGVNGLYLERLSLGGRVLLTSRDINSTWTLVEQIDAELN